MGGLGDLGEDDRLFGGSNQDSMHKRQWWIYQRTDDKRAYYIDLM